jgi:hypothetical protein
MATAPAPSTELPEVRADLRVAEFATEYVVWDPMCQRVHLFDGLHAVVFDACRTRAAWSYLLDDLAAAGIDATSAQQEAHRAITVALDHLRGLSMFADGGGRPP